MRTFLLANWLVAGDAFGGNFLLIVIIFFGLQIGGLICAIFAIGEIIRDIKARRLRESTIWWTLGAILLGGTYLFLEFAPTGFDFVEFMNRLGE